jgi:uncharacterized protein YcnI
VRRVRLPLALGLTAAGALALAPTALAQAILSPPVATKALQQFALSVPTELAGVATVAITMTVPEGFSIDSFERAPGWTRHVTQAGPPGEAIVNSVTWSGGSVPTGEDAVFRFNASARAGRMYVFPVRQSYSDGTVVEWRGADGATPAPTVLSVSAIGGGSRSTLAVVGVIVGALGVVVGGLALAAGRRAVP